MLTIKRPTDEGERAEICERVLRDLPDWLGIEASALDYIERARRAPFFAAYDGDHPIGFTYLHAHNAFSVEICCMGIMRQYHRVTNAAENLNQANA